MAFYILGCKPNIADVCADSVLTKITSQDSVVQRYYIKDSFLFMNDGSGFHSFVITNSGDSILSLRAADNLRLVLKKE